MTWINNWRNEDHHALEVLLGLGKGYHMTGTVAKGMNRDERTAYLALTRLSWRDVLDYGPSKHGQRTWRVKPSVLEAHSV